MENELNYPIRYAPMEVKEYPFNSDSNTCCFLAVPCYLISERKVYNKSGDYYRRYEVVFQVDSEKIVYNHNKNKIPEFNIYENCINSDVVDIASENYDDIRKYCEDYNKKLVEDQAKQDIIDNYYKVINDNEKIDEIKVKIISIEKGL